jgi:hypothetical protein
VHVHTYSILKLTFHFVYLSRNLDNKQPQVKDIIMEYKATILAVADATHYLVGATDINEGFDKLPQLDEVAVCKSLSAAKDLLRKNNIHVAQLTTQFAYDEMCGLSASTDFHQTIHL